jgi:hypothetical protein
MRHRKSLTPQSSQQRQMRPSKDKLREGLGFPQAGRRSQLTAALSDSMAVRSSAAAALMSSMMAVVSFSRYSASERSVE